jgi:hypothetical protein
MFNLNIYVSYLFLIISQYIIYILMKKINKNDNNNIDKILTVIYVIIWGFCVYLNINFLSEFIIEEYRFIGNNLILMLIIINIYRLFYNLFFI